MLTQYFTRSTKIPENGNVFKKTVFPSTLVICLFRDMMKCQSPCTCVRMEQVQSKGRTGKEKGHKLYMRPCCESLTMCR